ncbi:AlpA family phage regulatory protein [Pseudomonas neustonica]|uniref:AlpA family phage regulatory protein n=1 Tax=Pseudomonas neustonica TaxID=2487346 RepID=A0ABX9XQQ5_9PSED|nr:MULTISPECIES: AlpA family phage regulatory protein [Pseudomonas]ROZ86959.1 AlpA family phage regulatory protein [Pseudomonas sp. SSM44]ROZ88425.1 AlpA family phage regulatory protein [Pseudomonas neustonica]
MNEAKIIDPDSYIIRINEAAKMCGFSRSGLDKLRLKDATFPKAISLTNSKARNAPRGFIYAELKAWIDQRKSLRE